MHEEKGRKISTLTVRPTVAHETVEAPPATVQRPLETLSYKIMHGAKSFCEIQVFTGEALSPSFTYPPTL